MHVQPRISKVAHYIFTRSSNDQKLENVLRFLFSGDKVCGVGPCVVVDWVCKVISKQMLLDHQQDLMGQSFHQGRVGQRPHQEVHLQYDGQDALCMDQAWVTQVVKSTFTEDLRSSLEPHSLTKLDTVTGQELREHTSKSTKHSPSTVDHLKFTVLGKSFRLGDSPENGPKYLTRSGPYHGLLDGADLATAFLIVILPFPEISEADGESFTACPAKEGEEIAIVAAAIVISKVLQWSLSGNNGLNEESKHREHSKSAVLDLLYLELSKCLWVISKTQWVKASTGRPTSNTVSLNSSHQHNLASPDGQDALCMDQAWVAQVVKSTFTEDLGSGLEPHSLTELDTITGQELREDASKSTKHSPSAVDHLEFTVLGKAWGLTRERAQVLNTVRAIPWAARRDRLGDSLSHSDPSISKISEADGESFTACPAKEGEERAIVEAAMVLISREQSNCLMLGDSPENGPKYLTRSGPYHGLLDEADLATAFLIVILPFPVISEAEGESFTACPAKEGEERAIVEAAMIYIKRKHYSSFNLEL
ncbi:hypothetical protein H5410_007403 [Solanum commersonii]|uniref:Uncharacterized protein n=1 Tax=Solanum commersonii TaxID=4109 RepID=A0A9J6ACK4_SOLCO|nr:hypothetical protein H5410_007403 [Solanum commersonii]